MITLDRSPGGIEQSIITYVKAYHALGYHTLLYAPAHASIIKKLETLHLSSLTIKTFYWPILRFKSLCAQLMARDFLRACHNSRLILAHNARLLPVLKRFVKKRTPIVFIDHSGKLRRDIKKADYLITISQTAQQQLIQRYPEFQSRSCCIHHAIELPEKILYAPHDIPHIVAAGRFVEKKGFIPFIQAIALLRDQSLPFTVTLAGDGPQKPLLERLINEHHLSDRIACPGWVKDPIALFQSADIVCLPSLMEPFGLTLAEAMACGRACITTDCEGPLDIVGHSDAAIIVPKNNSDALAAALKELLIYTEKRVILAQRARAQITEHFGMEHLTEQLCILTNSLNNISPAL